MVKQLWVIANWKANKTVKEALEWVSEVGPQVPKDDYLKIVVCPPFVDLEQVAKEVKVGGFNLMVGAQDLSAFGVGAYTGEVPAVLLSDFISLSILGHSERRKNFNETDEMIAEKVEQAKRLGINSLVCVQDEMTPVPQGCNLVAYEPVWAIGTGSPDTPENANQIADSLKQKHSQDLEVLYGGSVNAGNVKAFLTQESINGVLVGGASLDPEEFIRIVKECVVEIA